MRARLLILAAAVALAAAAPPARAEFGGTLTTVARAFDSLQTIDGIERVRSWRPVDQLGHFTWDDLGARKAWTIDTSVRYRLDWGTGKGLQDHDFDVLIARAAWRSRQDTFGVQLGRLQSITGFGWKAYDGARLDFPRLRHLQAFCFAGAPVEVGDNGAPDFGSFTWGAGVTGIAPKHGSFGVEYELRKEGPVTLEETAGVDMSLRFAKTQVAANADYSLVMDAFGETTLVLSQEVARRHHVEARTSRVLPIWDASSIYSVFDVNPMDEVRLSYEYRGDQGLAIGVMASREDYEDTELEGPQDIRRVVAQARWSGRRNARHRSAGGWLDGWSGARVTLRHDTDLDVTSRLRLGGGVSWADFRNFARLTERDQIWSARARIRHDHGGKWDLGFEVEQFFGRDRNTTRGLLTFQARFGSARNERPWWGGRFQEGWASKRPAAATPAETVQ